MKQEQPSAVVGMLPHVSEHSGQSGPVSRNTEDVENELKSESEEEEVQTPPKRRLVSLKKPVKRGILGKRVNRSRA